MKTVEEIKELFRNNEIGFYEVCNWWLAVYPQDIFSEGSEVGKITRIILEILPKDKRLK